MNNENLRHNAYGWRQRKKLSSAFSVYFVSNCYFYYHLYVYLNLHEKTFAKSAFSLGIEQMLFLHLIPLRFHLSCHFRHHRFRASPLPLYESVMRLGIRAYMCVRVWVCACVCVCVCIYALLFICRRRRRSHHHHFFAVLFFSVTDIYCFVQ